MKCLALQHFATMKTFVPTPGPTTNHECSCHTWNGKLKKEDPQGY